MDDNERAGTRWLRLRDRTTSLSKAPHPAGPCLPVVNGCLIRDVPPVTGEGATKAQRPLVCLRRSGWKWAEVDDIDVSDWDDTVRLVETVPHGVADDPGADMRVRWSDVSDDAKDVDEPGRAENDALQGCDQVGHGTWGFMDKARSRPLIRTR